MFSPLCLRFNRRRSIQVKAINMSAMMMLITLMAVMVIAGESLDTNDGFNPCSDTKVQRWDGFTFGLAFSSKESFFKDEVQLSPCDRRLSLQGSNAQLAIFRPKVDELTYLTINGTDFDPAKAGGYMVAFAGRQYAARSIPTLVTDKTYTVTSFTLVLEFQEGTLINLYWKKYGCASCKEDSKTSVCVNNQECGVPTSSCKGNGGSVDCSISLQLAFSGTDLSADVLNSWYEITNLRQYSLLGLYNDINSMVSAP